MPPVKAASKEAIDELETLEPLGGMEPEVKLAMICWGLKEAIEAPEVPPEWQGPMQAGVPSELTSELIKVKTEFDAALGALVPEAEDALTLAFVLEATGAAGEVVAAATSSVDAFVLGVEDVVCGDAGLALRFAEEGALCADGGVVELAC